MNQRSICDQKPKVNGSIVKWKTTKHAPTLCIATPHGGINKSLQFIARHFAEPIQVPDLAKISGLSRRGFHKAFEKHVGTKPGRALRAIRLDYAKLLLLEKDVQLIHIARQSGFLNTNSFCVAFRRDVGISPKRFRQQQRLTLPTSARRPKSSSDVTTGGGMRVAELVLA